MIRIVAALLLMPSMTSAQTGPAAQEPLDPALISRVLARAVPIDEEYRRRFAICDATGRFGSLSFPIKRKTDGRTIWYGCRTDPSRLSRLSRVPQVNETWEAIVFTAKLAHDRDGSRAACDDTGPTDQCGTSLMLKPTATRPCPRPTRNSGVYCRPIDADEIPYVAIPGSAPAGIDGREFRNKTGIKTGDLGVVIANGRAVPVIVADVGPAYKIGEGSTALLRALSNDGRPHTISGGVTYVLFPNTTVDRDVSADQLKRLVAEGAATYYERLEFQGE